MKENSPISCKTAALQYVEKFGFSVIPINGKNKKPLTPWKEFQERHPTEDEVNTWWDKWPIANVAIVTGKVSGVCAIDIDESNGFESIQNYVFDSIAIPTSKTPRGGQHLYFQMPEKSIGNNSRIIPGCDFRGEGGYIIAPPSKGYTWLDGLSLSDAEPPPLPMQVLNKYLSTNTYKGKVDEKVDGIEKNQYFQQGRRDEDLFHVANCLLKGYCGLLLSTRVLEILASNCNPPFSPKEAQTKIQSALARNQRRERNISEEVREFVLSTSGYFSSTDVYHNLLLSTPQDRKIIWKVLNKMVEEGLTEKDENRNGYYRRLDSECEEIDVLNAPEETVNITLPFGIDEKAIIMPGNIIVVAGEINVGKTALLLNIAHDNMYKFDIHYFSSEMGVSELKKRLKKFDYLSPPEWKVRFYERSENFSDVIKPGKGKINIIDFLELYDQFYLVGKHLADIHKKLNGAIAIVAIQKPRGRDEGIGGERSLEKPRLYLSMSPNKLRIKKAKNWATQNNPNGLETNFKLVDGCKFIKQGDWHLGSEK